MPRRRRKIPPRNRLLSDQERALIEALEPGRALPVSVQKKIRATAPFAGQELRALAVEKILADNKRRKTLAISLPPAIAERLEEHARVQDRRTSEVALEFLVRGMEGTGFAASPDAIRAAVEAFLRDVVLGDAGRPPEEGPEPALGSDLIASIAARVKKERG